jgi:hypothetical protein
MSKGLQTLDFSFEGTSLTHFGGLFLIQSFCKALGLHRRLQRFLKAAPKSGNYPPADLIVALLLVFIAGLRRINKTEILQYNGLFLSLIGLEKFPDQSTLRRFLRRLSPQTIRQMVRCHDYFRSRLFNQPQPRSTLIFDLDSVVLTVYGTQQGARLGYNPKKKGRRSYHPLLCFEAHGQEFWHGSLRPGDCAANTGVIPFFKRCLAKVPPQIARSRIRVRADAGFFSRKLVSYLDQAGCGFIIVARTYPNLCALAAKAGFKRLHFGWEVAELVYRPRKWKPAHRFIVVRRPLAEDPEELKQLTLFTDRKYSYSILVTNLKLDSWRVWRAYTRRATIEKTIRELLYDLPLNKIPTQEWIANVAYFQMLLFAYDVVHWFKRLCLPAEYLHATVETVRSDFLVLPAKLTSRAGRNVLQLPKDYHYQKAFLEAAKRIKKLRIALMPKS